MDPHRNGRVSEALREELAEIIGHEMSDPRLRSVDVTEVVVAPGMRKARVRVHVEAPDGKREETVQVLEGARQYIRNELSSRLRMYRIPDLHFESDLDGRKAGRVDLLLNQIRKGRPKDDGSGENSASE